MKPWFPVILTILALLGCSGGPSSTYPPPDQLKLAPLQRQEFLDTFLQGRWCEAQQLFEQSTDNFLRSDNVCQVAYNHYLAYAMQQYIGKEDEGALKSAQQYRELGFGCPHLQGIPSVTSMEDDENSNSSAKNQNQLYQAQIETRNWTDLQKALEKEEDALFQSVYSRKAATAAIRDNDLQIASRFIALAREVDARQGWVVFLTIDWRLNAEVTTSQAEKKKCIERAQMIEALIQPCQEGFER